VRHGSVTGIRTDLSGPNTVPEILDPRNDTPEKKRGSEWLNEEWEGAIVYCVYKDM